MTYPIVDATPQAGVHAKAHNHVIDPVLHFGADATGATDATATIQAAISAASGGTVHLPDGEFLLDGALELTVSNVVIKGNGEGTVLVKGDASSTYSFFRTGDTKVSNVTIADLTLDGNKQGQAGIEGYIVDCGDTFNSPISGLTVRGLRCLNSPKWGIVARKSHNVTVKDCFFQGNGENDDSQTITFTGRGLRVQNNVFRYVPFGVILASGAHDVVMDGNDIDMGWWYSATTHSGSGAGVTYSHSVAAYPVDTITDTGASFPDFGYLQRHVRVMPVLESGAGGGVSYTASTVTDTGATFSSSGLLRGHIIRTATSFAIVYSVTSETVLQVEEWLDRDTYEPVAPPAAGTAYTAYGIYVGLIAANTATSISILWRMAALNGVEADPANGTLYEVFSRMVYPLQAASGSSGVSVSHNLIQRSYGDMLEMQGTDYTVVGNTLYGGSDTGIACVGARGTVVGNRVAFCGQTAIGVYGQGVAQDIEVVGNQVRDSPWLLGQDLRVIAGITVFTDSTRATIVGNTAVSTITANPLALYGFGIAGREGAVTNISFSGNISHGYGTGFKFDGGTESNSVYWGPGNVGSRAVAGNYEWLARGSPAEEGGSNPEGVVPARVGTLYSDTTDGDAYLKQTGTGISGWAKMLTGSALIDTPILTDSFNRANSNTTLGSADLGGAWTADSGTWGIASNKAYYVSGGSTTPGATLSAGVDDYIVSCDITLSATRALAGISLRGTDVVGAGQHLIVYLWIGVVGGLDVNRIVIYKNDVDEGYYGQADGPAAIGSYAAGLTLGETYTLKAVAKGSLVTVLIKGALDPDFLLAMAYDLTTVTTDGRPAETLNLTTGQLCGLELAVGASGDDGTSTFNNFAVAVPNTSLLATSATVSDADFQVAPAIGTIIGSSNGGVFYLNLRTGAATWKRVAVT